MNLAKKFALPGAAVVICHLSLFANTPDFEKIKHDTFIRSNMAVFNTLSGTPYLHIHYFFEGTNYRIKFNKQILTSDNPKQFDQHGNFGVVQKALLGYGSHTKDPGKFAGSRNRFFEILFVKPLRKLGFVRNPQFKEHPFAELYQNRIPMMWQLKNVQEAELFMTILACNVQENTITANEKPILVLSIKEDQTLAGLSPDLKKMFNTYFYLLTPEQDQEVIMFLQCKIRELCKQNYKLEGSKPERPYEPIVERIVNDFEKFCNEFSSKEVVPSLVKYLGTAIVINRLWKKFFEGSLDKSGTYIEHILSTIVDKLKKSESSTI